MAATVDWILDESKFFERHEQRLLRRYVRRQRSSKRVSPRYAWNTWFLVELAFETGLRIFEMQALTCGDMKTHFNRPGVVVQCGKGGDPRYVRIRKEFCGTVDAFMRWKEKAGEPVAPTDPLFHSPRTGKALTVRALQKAFAKACRAVGITSHSPHHCRHTYASELLVSSHGNIKLVQKQLGHKKITTTQIYADIFDPEMDAAVDGLYRRRPCRNESENAEETGGRDE